MLVASYEHTLAEQGNIPAGKELYPASTPQNDILLSGLTAGSIEKVENQVAADGGQAAESLVKAIGRAVEILWAHERLQELCARFDCQTLDGLPSSLVYLQPAPSKAVTTLDLERLALDVPGTRIVRARAWTNMHPAYPCYEAPGHVTVVIAPALPQGWPEPGSGLKKVVWRYLNRLRLVTTRVHVTGPKYVLVRVQAKVRRSQGVDAHRLVRDVEAAIDRFLDPLVGGGEGRGWPFGRDVYRTEILQVIDSVPGVEYVAELNILDEKDESLCGNSCVGPFSLVTPGEHLITVVQEK